MRPTIYIIDDDKPLLKYMESLLREDGYETRGFEDAESCLNAMKRGNIPDLVLADYGLPGMNGIEFLSRCREMCPRTWRLLITGNRIDDEFVKAAINQAGVHQFISKPFGMQEFLFSVKKALEEQRQHLQLQELFQELEEVAKKKAKEALVFHRRYKTLFQRLQLMVFTADMDTGRFLELNPFGERLLGIDIGKGQGFSLKDVFPTRHVYENMRRLLEERGEVRGMEIPLIPPQRGRGGNTCINHSHTP